VVVLAAHQQRRPIIDVAAHAADRPVGVQKAGGGERRWPRRVLPKPAGS
jgi:hypothetical protein